MEGEQLTITERKSKSIHLEAGDVLSKVATLLEVPQA